MSIELDTPARLSEQTITSPRGHQVFRTAFKDTPEYSAKVHWLAARRKIITSTDVAAILGWDKHRSAYSVYVDKTTPLDLAAPDLADTNEAVKWGNLLEDVVAKEAGRMLGRTLIDHGRHTIFWTRDVVPGVPIGCSLDREITPELEECANCLANWTLHNSANLRGEPNPALPDRCLDDEGRPIETQGFVPAQDPRGPGVGEGKTTGEFNHGEDWKETEDDEVGAPLRAQVQVQVSCAVLGWEWGVIWGLLGGHSFHLQLRELERDPDFLPFVTPRIQDFWKRVEQRDPPPVDGSESTYEALKRQYPSDSGFEVALPTEAVVWDGELRDAKAREAKAKADVQTYGNKLRAAIGEARIGVIPGGSRYSLARTKDPKPTCCPACATIVTTRKASRPLKRLADED